MFSLIVSSSVEESIARQVGARIFNVAPSQVSVNNLNDNVWIIEKEGICVVGKIYPCPENNEKTIFEVTESDREIVGFKYTI